MVRINDFFQRIARKVLILADTILDHLTLERASTQRLRPIPHEFWKIWDISFQMSHRPSRIKIVRLAATWIFLVLTRKTAFFFAKFPSPRHFCNGKFFRDRTMRKLRSWGFLKSYLKIVSYISYDVGVKFLKWEEFFPYWTRQGPLYNLIPHIVSNLTHSV